MPVTTRRSRASTFQIISERLSENGTMVTFCLGYFSSSTHFVLVTKMAQKVWRHCDLVYVHDRYSHAGNCFGLLANIGLFFFPLVTDTFSSLKVHDSLSTLYQGSRFNSPMPGVKVSQTEFLIFSSFHHRFQLLIVGNRYLLMNFHVVQFQYGFELTRLTYPQFLQTFQDYIGWNFCHR